MWTYFTPRKQQSNILIFTNGNPVGDEHPGHLKKDDK